MNPTRIYRPASTLLSSYGARIIPRRHSSTKIGADDLLGPPSWSVKTLLPNSRSKTPEVTPETLRHLLRLSALPPPTSIEQEKEMLSMLESQLHFVREVQSVDTTGIKPLQSLRDESAEAVAETMITIDKLKDEFAKETVVGKNGRIVRAQEPDIPTEDEKWDPLSLATKTAGRYFVVETSKKSSG